MTEDDEIDTCHVCDGAGRIRTAAGRTIDCPECDGYGQVRA